MAKPQRLEINPAEFIADVAHLSAEEIGVYILLMTTLLKQGGTLPNNPKRLAIICKVSSAKWRKIWPEIEDFFDVTGEVISSAKIKKQLTKSAEISERRRSSGAKGGVSKSMKAKHSNANQMLDESDSKPLANANQMLDESDNKPLANANQMLDESDNKPLANAKQMLDESDSKPLATAKQMLDESDSKPLANAKQMLDESDSKPLANAKQNDSTTSISFPDPAAVEQRQKARLLSSLLTNPYMGNGDYNNGKSDKNHSDLNKAEGLVPIGQFTTGGFSAQAESVV